MRLAIDHRSRLPLHAQVESLLRELCALPEHRGGALLPDEVGLAKKLGVSRNTVRAAVQRLVDDGLLERRRGVGTRVVKAPAAVHSAEWEGFLDELEPRGEGVTAQVVRFGTERAPTDVAGALGVGAATEVLRLDRILADGDGPLARIRSWFHPRLVFPATSDFRRPLWSLIERELGIIPTTAHEEIATEVADTDTARALALKRGTPVLLRRRVVADAKGQTLEVALAWYRADQRRQIHLRRDPQR